MYASRLSTVSSNSDYPSDLSSITSTSLKHSMLGLTDSPVSQGVRSAPTSPGGLVPPRPRQREKRSQSNLRESHSAASLRTVDERRAVPREATKRASARDLTQSPSPAASPSVRKIHRKPAPSRSEPAIADDWEAELVRNAQRIQLSDRPVPPPKASEEQLREEQRKKDAEWERSGMWEIDQNAAREAEDRTRRDVGRAVGE